MKHLKVLQISGLMIALLSLSTPRAWAQTNVTVPTYCQSCPAPAGTVTALNCAGVTASPTVYTIGAAYNGTASIPYTGGNGGSYAAGSVASTGVTGFTATWAAGTLASGAGSIPVTITGSSTTAGQASFPITIGGQSCTIMLSACGAFVSSGVFKAFLCHNLGANPSLDPHTPVVGLQGAYIQWGRRGPNTTGNSVVDWQTAANTSVFAAAPTASNPNDAAIAGWNTSANSNDELWRTSGGAKTADDPCPSGFRVPTQAEWTGVNANNMLSSTGSWTFGITNYGTALHYGPNASTKQLTLPAAGDRSSSNGSYGQLFSRGNKASYWSSTARFYLVANNSPTVSIIQHLNGIAGMPVRCIAE